MLEKKRINIRGFVPIPGNNQCDGFCRLSPSQMDELQSRRGHHVLSLSIVPEKSTSSGYITSGAREDGGPNLTDYIQDLSETLDSLDSHRYPSADSHTRTPLTHSHAIVFLFPSPCCKYLLISCTARNVRVCACLPGGTDGLDSGHRERGPLSRLSTRSTSQVSIRKSKQAIYCATLRPLMALHRRRMGCLTTDRNAYPDRHSGWKIVQIGPWLNIDGDDAL